MVWTKNLTKDHIKVALVLIAVVGFIVHAAYDAGYIGLEHRTRTWLEDDLLDASSAKFRRLRLAGHGAVCGEVNAKNRFGAYIGYRRFYAGKHSLALEDDPLHGLWVIERCN